MRPRPHGQWTFRECPIIIYNNRPARRLPSGREKSVGHLTATPLFSPRTRAASSVPMMIRATELPMNTLRFFAGFETNSAAPIFVELDLETSEPVLAVPRTRAEEVKELVERLKAQKLWRGGRASPHVPALGLLSEHLCTK